MATLSGGLSFTGSLGDISAYRMKGSDKIILRTKGTVSQSRRKHHPNYELTRRNNEEWKACIAAGNGIRTAIYAVKHLADYNFSGPLHALCKHIQLDDDVNEKGKRSVLISKEFYKLEGFGLNKLNTFESIVRHPLAYHIDKIAGTAAVSIPELIAGINLFNPLKQPLYRFICMLGTVPDMLYDPAHNLYRAAVQNQSAPAVVYTDWHTWKENRPAADILLAIKNWQVSPSVSLILSAGIEFGVPVSATEIKMVKYAGAAKLMKLA